MSRTVYKDRAKHLREILLTLGHEVSHGHALEALSRLDGARNWNEAVIRGTSMASADIEGWFGAQTQSPRHTWRLLVEGCHIRASIRAGIELVSGKVFNTSTSLSHLLAQALRVAEKTSHKVFAYDGENVWRAEPSGSFSQVSSLRGRRCCLALVQQDHTGQWVPSFVVEDEAGHLPSIDPLGADLAVAQLKLAEMNLKRGITAEECDDILATSLAVSQEAQALFEGSPGMRPDDK